MVTNIRVRILVNSIIAVNWVLSKLTRALAEETVDILSAIKSNVIVIADPSCNLDSTMDNETNTRKSLNTWVYRQKEQNFNGN
jgi:hypothetical protein